MKFLVVHVVALLVALVPALAQTPRRPASPISARAQSRSLQGDLALTFLPSSSGIAFSGNPAGGANIRLGTVSRGSQQTIPGIELERRGEGLVVRTHFGLRIERGAATPGTANLSSFLLYPSGPCRFKLNGMLLTGQPQLIEPQMQFGRVANFTLEVEIPASAPEGELPNNIGFIVSAN